MFLFLLSIQTPQLLINHLSPLSHITIHLTPTPTPIIPIVHPTTTRANPQQPQNIQIETPASGRVSSSPLLDLRQGLRLLRLLCLSGLFCAGLEGAGLEGDFGLEGVLVRGWRVRGLVRRERTKVSASGRGCGTGPAMIVEAAARAVRRIVGSCILCLV